MTDRRPLVASGEEPREGGAQGRPIGGPEVHQGVERAQPAGHRRVCREVAEQPQLAARVDVEDLIADRDLDVQTLAGGHGSFMSLS